MTEPKLSVHPDRVLEWLGKCLLETDERDQRQLPYGVDYLQLSGGKVRVVWRGDEPDDLYQIHLTRIAPPPEPEPERPELILTEDGLVKPCPVCEEALGSTRLCPSCEQANGRPA